MHTLLDLALAGQLHNDRSAVVLTRPARQPRGSRRHTPRPVEADVAPLAG